MSALDIFLQNERSSERPGCRKLGALPQLVHILASGEESGLVAAALWALLQLAADDPANQRVCACPALPMTGCISPSEASSWLSSPPISEPASILRGQWACKSCWLSHPGHQHPLHKDVISS